MDQVSTREDRFEQQMCTAVEAYFLCNSENDPLPKFRRGRCGWLESVELKPNRLKGCWKM